MDGEGDAGGPVSTASGGVVSHPGSSPVIGVACLVDSCVSAWCCRLL